MSDSKLKRPIARERKRNKGSKSNLVRPGKLSSTVNTTAEDRLIMVGLTNLILGFAGRFVKRELSQRGETLEELREQLRTESENADAQDLGGIG